MFSDHEFLAGRSVTASSKWDYYTPRWMFGCTEEPGA